MDLTGSEKQKKRQRESTTNICAAPAMQQTAGLQQSVSRKVIIVSRTPFAIPRPRRFG
jgi:hypothetical protein